ncbi:Hypothetical predicted protein [Octopus vulgaris]|uniref:PiggyBac transposable element-derived protein 4-like n=1 Tax=Octopus vulgaris TaxID=6645 RepID=A0AA36AWM6_OCTVU|nr:Hypothetical predicted protein [Octopus vulgaris]
MRLCVECGKFAEAKNAKLGEYRYVRDQYLPLVCYQVPYCSVVLSNIPKHKNLSEDQISKSLLELEEEWEENSSDSFYCSEDDGESDCVLDSLGSTPSDDEDTQKQLSASHPVMNERYASRYKQELHLQSFKDKRRRSLIQLRKEFAGVDAKQEHDKQSSSSANISQPNKKRRRSSASFEIPQPKQKGRCSLCSPKKEDRKTRTTCKNCNIHICQEYSNVVCIHCHEEL